jgi:broad specificity phosphatase PhoE
MAPRALVLVKHAQPVLDAARPAREWILGPEGDAQARDLASGLRSFLPFHLITSPEPKAERTAAIVGDALGVTPIVVPGLQEFDRPKLPIMSPGEHERVNRRIFDEPARPVLGTESARGALARFEAAVRGQVGALSAGNLVAVTHGTVISLFVAAHNDVDAFEIWRRLGCATFAVLELESFRLAAPPEPGGGMAAAGMEGS